MIDAPSAPVNLMFWPSTVGSFAGTDNGLRAPATGEDAADGDATGDTASDATGDKGGAAVVGTAAAGVVVPGCAEQPSDSNNVALLPSPPVIFKTRRTRSRRSR